ncbi:hypothetical protein VTI74DRAFT_6698 [Chaetomium olivicolor]
MRFSKLLLAASAPIGLLARGYSDQLSPGELVALLEKHNLAIVPKSELTDALTELNALLKSQRVQPRDFGPKFARQNITTTSSGSDSGSGSGRTATVSANDFLGLGDLGDVLKGLFKPLEDLVGLLKALENLLTAEFLQGFHDAMVYLAQTLQPPAPALIQSLLKKGGPLIDMLGEIDLKGLLDQLKGVDLNSLVGAALKLLSEKNINNIESLVTNGAALLTPSFVNQTSTLIGDVSPLLGELSPLLKQLTELDLDGVLKAVAPLLAPESIQGIVTLLDNAEALLTADFVKQIGGLLKSVGPLLENISPLLEKITPLLDKLAGLDLQGIVDAVAPLLTPESVQGIVTLLKNAEALLTAEFVKSIGGLLESVSPLLEKVTPLLDKLAGLDLQGILDAIAPLLTPESVQGIVGLLKNAEALLTAEFVKSIGGLLELRVSIYKALWMLSHPCSHRSLSKVS